MKKGCRTCATLSRALTEAWNDLVRTHASLASAGLALYVFFALVPLGVLLWRLMPTLVTPSFEGFLFLADATGNPAISRWLMHYLSTQAEVLAAPSIGVLAFTLALVSYATISFITSLSHLLSSLWGTSPPRRSAVRVGGAMLVALLAFGWVYGGWRIVGVLGGSAPLMGAALATGVLALTASYALLLAAATGTSLHSFLLWRTAAIAALLSLLAVAGTSIILRLAPEGVGGGYVNEALAFLFFLWLLWWSFLAAIAVGHRLSTHTTTDDPAQ